MSKDLILVNVLNKDYYVLQKRGKYSNVPGKIWVNDSIVDHLPISIDNIPEIYEYRTETSYEDIFVGEEAFSKKEYDRLISELTSQTGYFHYYDDDIEAYREGSGIGANLETIDRLKYLLNNKSGGTPIYIPYKGEKIEVEIVNMQPPTNYVKPHFQIGSAHSGLATYYIRSHLKEVVTKLKEEFPNQDFSYYDYNKREISFKKFPVRYYMSETVTNDYESLVERENNLYEKVKRDLTRHIVLKTSNLNGDKVYVLLESLYKDLQGIHVYKKSNSDYKGILNKIKRYLEDLEKELM